jgi:drug/metabolite transporter (DMT)-like permease
MTNLFTFIGFFLFTTAGMIFIKLGGHSSQHKFFTVPVIDFKLTLLSLIGFFLYGLSFLLYASLLQKYELTFLNPVTIGITSVLIFISGVIFFNEALSVVKVASLALILAGVLLINLFK